MTHVLHRPVDTRSWGTQAAGSGWPDGDGPDWYTAAVAAHLGAGGKVLHGGRVYWLYVGRTSMGDEPKGKAVPVEQVGSQPTQGELFGEVSR